MESSLVRRLSAVAGYNQKVNDVLFVAKQDISVPTSVVIFFGGDVQVLKLKTHQDVTELKVQFYF